jgi:hypothetical protein
VHLGRDRSMHFFHATVGQYGFVKKCVGTCYPELFLHPVGSAGLVMHSSVSEARNVETLFFMLRWDRYGFHNNRAGTHCAKPAFFSSGRICWSRSAFRCIRVVKRRCTIFQVREGPVHNAQNCTGTCYAEHVSLYPAGSVVRVVHFNASGV